MVGDQYEHLRSVDCDERGVDWCSIGGMERMAGSMVAAPAMRDTNPAFAVQVTPLGAVLCFRMGLE